MSDYLTRVVERAAGRAPAVRPLAAPAFGSGPVSRAPGREHGADIAGPTPPGADPVPRRETAVERPAGARDAAGIEEPGSGRPTPPSLPPAAPHQQAPERPVPSVPRPPAGGEGAPAASHPLTVGTASRWGAEAATGMPVVAQRPGITPADQFYPPGPGEAQVLPAVDTFEQAARFVRRRDERQRSDLLMPGEPGPTGAAGEGERAGAPVREVPAPSPPEAGRPKSVRRGDQPQLKVADKVDAPQGEGAAPPTIRISIGRIDVRAIAPQQAPHKAAAPPAPKISLDDYLRRQSGGAR